MKARAVILESPGKFPRLQQVELDDQLKAREVLIRIYCAGMNHRDLWIVQGLYPGIRPGVILGSDGAGVIEKTGSQVTEFQPGDEVIVNPSINWGNNPQFQGPDYEILGNPRDGTFCDYLRIPVEYVYRKPPHLTWEEAGALPLAGLTAYRALFTRGNLQPGEKVLITGIGGGVALMALVMAVEIGAQVWVTSSSEAKLHQAIQLGARGGFLYTRAEWHKEALKATEGGVDLILDGASGNALNAYMELLRPGGRLVIYGQTAGKVQQFSTARLFYRHLNILGSTMGSPEDFSRMLQFWENRGLHPVVDHVFPPSQIQEAFRRMEQKQQFGKIVLDFRQS